MAETWGDSTTPFAAPGRATGLGSREGAKDAKEVAGPLAALRPGFKNRATRYFPGGLATASRSRRSPPRLALTRGVIPRKVPADAFRRPNSYFAASRKATAGDPWVSSY